MDRELQSGHREATYWRNSLAIDRAIKEASRQWEVDRVVCCYKGHAWGRLAGPEALSNSGLWNTFIKTRDSVSDTIHMRVYR